MNNEDLVIPASMVWPKQHESKMQIVNWFRLFDPSCLVIGFMSPGGLYGYEVVIDSISFFPQPGDRFICYPMSIIGERFVHQIVPQIKDSESITDMCL